MDASGGLRTPICQVVAKLALFAGFVACVAGAFFLVRAHGRHAPHPPGRPAQVLGAGAFFHGGTPARDADLEAWLVDNLTDLLIETDAHRRGSSDGAPRARRIEELRAAPIITSRGPALARAWRELIDSLDRWAHVPIGSPRARVIVDELTRRAEAVNDQLAALGLGYYLQADTLLRHTAHVVVFVYRVERVTFLRAGGERRRVLDLHRLDRVNLDVALLGRLRDESTDPVVLLDHIDRFVRDRVIPAAAGDPYPLGDDAFQDSPAGQRLMIAAADAIRSELHAARATDAEAITALVCATVRRHEARHGIDLERTRPLRYPRVLAGLVGPRGSLTTRAELELAAYLSQIGNDPATPQLALWNLATHAFNREHWTSAEAAAATIVITGLARNLGQTVPDGIVSQPPSDRDALAEVARTLAYRSDDDVRAAARRLWVELYGEPMLPITEPR